MSQKSIGLIEAIGLCAGITAADAAVKTANVKLLGYEYSKGDGMTVVKVEGDVAACKAAVAAGSKAAEPLGGVKSAIVIARPANGIIPTLIKNKENVGGEYHLATGKRPKGQSAGPVLVKRSVPVAPAVAKVEEPVEEDETPIELPVEAPVEETPVETPVEEIIEETPVEEPVAEEPVVEETVVEAVEETPVKEDPVEAVVEEPVVEESVVEEIPTEEPAAEIVEEVAEEVITETPAEEPAEDKPADDGLVVKSTSRGRRGGRKAKGNSSKKDK
ncbi:MAG: BMC domain-containing protein [Lachnospiraceae bacterium]|nr:BMC domain-containing protein [Lachnospiraceae bacterium]